MPRSPMQSIRPSTPHLLRATLPIRRAAMSAASDLAAPVYGKSSTIISPYPKMPVASSSPRPCASSMPAIALRMSSHPGCALQASTYGRQEPMDVSSASLPWTAASVATSMAACSEALRRWRIRRSGRLRLSAPRPGRTSSSTALPMPSRSTQPRSRSTRPISTCRIRRCSLRSIATPGSSIASWSRSMPRLHRT